MSKACAKMGSRFQRHEASRNTSSSERLTNGCTRLRLRFCYSTSHAPRVAGAGEPRSRWAPLSTEDLRTKITNELVAIPIKQWGDFFPFLVAVWRYMDQHYPGALGEISCGYDTEPYWAGPRANWFLETVEDERIFGIIERMAYCVADGLEQHHYDNGFVRSAKDLPDLSRTDLEQLTVEINAIMRQRLT
jgi:hypothetical protein